jgi:hypothetical protein
VHDVGGKAPGKSFHFFHVLKAVERVRH